MSIQDNILRAAVVLIEQKGFDRMSMRDIISEAGLSGAGHLYHYFKNKNEILFAVIRREFEEDFQEFLLLLDIDGQPFSGFVNITAAHLEEKARKSSFKLTAKTWGAVMSDDRFAPLFLEIKAKFDAKLAEAYNKGIEMGVISPKVDLNELGGVFHMLWHGFKMRQECPFIPINYEQAATSMRLLHKAILM